LFRHIHYGKACFTQKQYQNLKFRSVLDRYFEIYVCSITGNNSILFIINFVKLCLQNWENHGKEVSVWAENNKVLIIKLYPCLMNGKWMLLLLLLLVVVAARLFFAIFDIFRDNSSNSLTLWLHQVIVYNTPTLKTWSAIAYLQVRYYQLWHHTLFFDFRWRFRSFRRAFHLAGE
jgi:hypothetical protein